MILLKNNIWGLSGILLFLCACSSVALAETHFYVGGSIGESYVEEDDVPGEDFDSEDFAFKAFAGYRFHNNFAVELDYIDYGDHDDDILGVDIEIEDLYAVALYGVGIVPISEKFELFVKLGAAYWDGDAKANVMGNTVTSSDDGTEFAYGLGASYGFSERFAVRVEYEEVDSDDLDQLGVFSIGGEVRF